MCKIDFQSLSFLGFFSSSFIRNHVDYLIGQIELNLWLLPYLCWRVRLKVLII